MSMTTRRELMEQIATGLVALAGAPACWAEVTRPTVAAAPAVAEPRRPVVSFFMDQPYLDLTGTAKPYIPPRGTRSAQSLAEFDVPLL